jgi:putative ABC transport system permease protein
MFFKMQINSLVRRRSRMMSALLAIAIGATVVLGMTAVSFDIPRQMGREFRNYGANMILTASGSDARMSLEDAREASKVIPPEFLFGMTPYRYEIVRINMQGYTVAGTDFNQARSTSPYWNVTGEYPSGEEEILIGFDIAEFTKLSAGSAITVTGRATSGARFSRGMKVSGIVRTGGAEDGFIFMRLDTLEYLMGDSGIADVVEVSVVAETSALRALINDIAAASSKISPQIVKRVAQSEASVLSRLRSLFFLVTLIVLALTIFCVGTTMTTVVLERRKEIGLKKALGADNKMIAAEFLCEGLLLGCAGGLLGVALGYFFARAVSMSVFGREMSLGWYLPPMAILVSIAVTIIACLLPVRRAVDVEPAVVLRGE